MDEVVVDGCRGDGRSGEQAEDKVAVEQSQSIASGPPADNNTRLPMRLSAEWYQSPE